MKCSLSCAALLSLAVSLAVTLTPRAVAQEDSSVPTETARRQMLVRDAMQEVQKARTAYSDKRYSDAVEYYRNALAVLPHAETTAKQEQFIKDSLSDALIAKAMDYRDVGRTVEALDFLKEAIKLSPNNKRARMELSRTEDPERTNPALTPQHVGEVEAVQRFLTRGYSEIDLGKYDEAIASFNQALTIDPYNTAARKGMEAANKRKQSYYAAARDSARSAALAAADALWEEPLPVDHTVDAPAASGNDSGVIPDDAEAEERIGSALGDIRLQQVIFDDSPVMDVVSALQAQINRAQKAGESSAGRPINVTANFGPIGSKSYTDIMARSVNLNMSDVSVRDILDALVRQLGITYHVTPLGVELSYSGKDFGPMVERAYSVAPHFFDAETGGDDEDDEDSDFKSSKVVVKRVNPVQALKEMGISFPEGANARYDASSRVLTVRNTPYNQEEIAGLVSVPLESQDRSVILNVIAVEVNENDLADLGFDWLVNMNLGNEFLYAAGGAMTTAAKAGWVTATGAIGASEGANDPTASMTEGLRSGREALTANNMERLITTGSAQKYDADMLATTGSPGVLAMRGVWNSCDVTMIMRGLNQKKSADILYNPRLVFSPGAEQQVTFTNVREMFYPESYSEPQITSSSYTMGSYTNTSGDTEYTTGRNVIATAAHPEEFTRFGMTEDSVGGIGAVIQVHDAQVAQDGKLVTLALTVTLNDFEGFINWGSPIESVMTTDSGDEGISKMTLTENQILKPVFKRHMENTKISVAPGSVIVIGGLKEGRAVHYEDKLPVLGDLPLVGRFFRSSGAENVRKAFMFFVKVDLVDPTGKDPMTGSRPTDVTDN